MMQRMGLTFDSDIRDTRTKSILNVLLINALQEFTLASTQWTTTFIYFGPARHSIESSRSQRSHHWPQSGLLDQPGTWIRTELRYW